MSQLQFSRANALIQMVDGNGAVIRGPFQAYNNVAHVAKGPWPNGTFPYVGHVPHTDLSDPNSAYGTYGILQFLVPGRIGMGVHSGHVNQADGLGRVGPAYCTLGCIRTTDPAMAAFVSAMSADPIRDIVVA
ncbi:MAG TPA: hypothetical protein VGH80_01405 [Xanthomonadaceae bacterium]|jgi:hypothetical protein